MPLKDDSKAVDDYIKNITETQQQVLTELRAIIKNELPNSLEGIAWSMPSYWQGTYLIHFQAFKNHLNIYVGPEAVDYLQERYPNLSYTKRGFQFNYNDIIPKQAIKDVCQWNLKEFGEKSDET